MRFIGVGASAAMLLLLAASGALGQSSSELRAQYEQTMEMLRQAESMGVDPSMLASLRESLEGLRQSIEEDERLARENANAAPPVETAPPPVAAAVALEPNLAASTCGEFGITEENYRQAALAGGGDVQMKTLCGQAMEYYSMYKRAVSQQHPEAWRTYDAHKQASAQLGAFDRDTRAAPTEGIVPDTKTATEVASERRAEEQAAEVAASNIPRPPQAPPCDGCVSPQ